MTDHSAYLRDLTTGSEWDKPSNGTCEKLTAAAAHIDAHDAKIKALVESIEHCKECAGDTVTMPTSVIHVICDAALAAAKETTA